MYISGLKVFYCAFFFLNMNVVTKYTIYYYNKFACVVLSSVKGNLFVLLGLIDLIITTINSTTPFRDSLQIEIDH